MAVHHRSPSLGGSFPWITLPENSGIEGDYHAGITIQHHNHGKANPNQPNLRQADFTKLELPGGFSGGGRRDGKRSSQVITYYRQVWERRQLHLIPPEG